MKNIFANCHVAVAGVPAALLIGAALSGRSAPPDRRRVGRRCRAHPCHHRGGGDDRRGQCHRRGRRGAGSHHGHNHGAHPGDGSRGPRVARRPGPRRPDARRARRRRSRRGRPGRARGGPRRRPGGEGGRSRAPAAEAGLALARASHDRIAGLEAKRSATAQELDEATATLRSAEARAAGASARTLQATSAVESARAASDQASTTESFTTITAPFDGLVTEKTVEPGNMASPGMPLLRLEDTRAFRLEVRVDESRIGQIRNGDRVPVLLGTGTTSIRSTVVEVSRAVDADARAFLVKIALPDAPGLRSGEFGKARFAGTPRRALTLPASAIVRRGQLTSVFVVDNGVARVRLVNLSESEVLAGLTESEVVILSPPSGLTDGRRVSVGGR